MKQLNSVIYEPDYIILNQELLTSLCLYYDKLILYSANPIEEELDDILSKKKDGYEQRASFIQNTLSDLIQEKIVTIYDSDSISKLESQFLDRDSGVKDIKVENSRIILQTSPNSYVDKILSNIRTNLCTPFTVNQLLRTLNTEILSDALGIPKLMINQPLIQSGNITQVSSSIENKIALQSLCSISLPRLSAVNVEDIMFLRKELEQELNEFKAGVLQLTYLLYKSIDITSEEDIKNEIDILVCTKIKAAVLDMQNHISKSNKNLFSKIAIKGSQFLLHGVLAYKGLSNIQTAVDKGSDFFSLLPNNSTTRSPEEKIAGYLLKVNNFYESSIF